MRYYNADGGEAEMCGNGGRCISRYAYLKRAAGTKMSFETMAGMHHAEIVEDQVKLEMTDPADIRLGVSLEVDSDVLEIDFANTGVPHTIVWVDDVDAVDVVSLGPKIRYHRTFAPAGTNANFVQVTAPNAMTIRTYERGVEDETLACGTGTVAAAILGGLTGKLQSPVEALTRSGLLLKVYFDLEGEQVKQVFLEGDAVIVFEGVLELPW
jgi:diaminopimelate epimerase